MALSIERKKDMSIYYWLVDLFADTPFISVFDEYNEGELVLPTVAVKTGVLNAVPFELGNRTQKNFRVWSIDIYTKNKAQRNDYAYRVLEAVDNGIPVYNYDEGFPPAVTPTQLGAIVILEKKHTPIDVIPELPEKMYWRGQVTILTEYSPY